LKEQRTQGYHHAEQPANRQDINMPRTAYITHADYPKHRLDGHPERPERIESIWKVIDSSNVSGDLLRLTPEPVTDDHLLLVHTPEHIARIKRTAEYDRLSMLDPDTYALPISEHIARLSAGAGISAVDALMTGQADNALVADRPPGHHATPNRAMGFCLYSNIAIAARYAQKTYNSINEVMIVDYDVHHGNGTQDAFYQDGSVLFISSHQYPYYPGTGSISETGRGDGKGATINMPLVQGTGNDGFNMLYEKVVWPAARRFNPDLILVSAGFDAHWVEPLASLQLDLAGYDHLTRELIRMADEICEGHIIFVLEGGYDLEAVSHGMLNVVYALQERDDLSDPLGSINLAGQSTQALAERLVQLHDLAE